MKLLHSMSSRINLISLFLCSSFFLSSCIVVGGSQERCEVKTIKVSDISEGGIKDISFHTSAGDLYYINRGLEQGLNLDTVRKKVLNKTVTLHLAKLLGGATSRHISQIKFGEEIIYTEFDE